MRMMGEIAGHSLGAQMVQRYSVLGRPHKEITYVVMNPATFLYLTPERPGPACPVGPTSHFFCL